ncbi:hypothetical protein BGZ46_004524, partial [Entomortierella lignicola]
MQVLPRLDEEIIVDENGTLQTTLSIPTTTTAAVAVTTTVAPTTTASSIASSTNPSIGPLDEIDEPNDPCYDSDTEAPLDWNAVAKNSLHYHHGQVIKSGYLMKKGERLKIWKKKWFVLRTTELAYYKDSKEYELLRITDIRDVHRAAEVPVKHKSAVFVILTPRRTFTVQAKDVAEMKDWIQAINQAKTQFDFTASSSDFESIAGSTVQLGNSLQQDGGGNGPVEVPSGSRPLPPTPTTRQEMILPRRQQYKPLSLSDPDLLNKREQARTKGKGITPPIPTPTSIPQSPAGFQGSPSVSSILDRPTPKVPRASAGLKLITSNTQAIQISTPSSPRMEQVHSNELLVGSFSSDQSNGLNAIVPETPTSPGGYYSGGEMFWAGHDHNASSGEEEDVVDDISILEAGRLASEANAPGAGIVAEEQLGSKLVRQGHLYKLGNKYKTWRKKWFVLRGDKLTYYKNTKEYQPHGIIPLSTIIDCLQMDPVSKSKQYCLRIVTTKRSFVCSAPDEDTLLQWLDALHVECDRVAHEARQEEIADIQALRQRQGRGSESLNNDGHDGDDDDEQLTKPLGRRARLKLNLHNSLPHRSRSKSGDGMGLFGSSSSANNNNNNNDSSSGGSQIRKELSLDSSAGSSLPSPGTVEREREWSAGTTVMPNVTFQMPTVA